MKIILILLVPFLICPSALGQSRTVGAFRVSDDELLLRELTNKWIEADAKGDAATVNSLLAEEFSFLGGSIRAQYLASMNPDPSLTVEAAVVEDQKVQIYGETAIVTGLNSYKFTKDGKPIQARFPSMTVWVKKSGRWLCVKACTLPAVTGV